MLIYPSLISSPLLELAQTLTLFNNHCDGYHIDIMDDHFVPNLTWGGAFCNEIKQATSLPLFVHLMVDDPWRWLNRLNLGASDCFIFHYETVEPSKIGELIAAIKDKGWHVGIALNPETSISYIMPFIYQLDEILIMSVNPGFSGQTFMPEVMNKAKDLIAYRIEHKDATYNVGMDGGISEKTIQDLAIIGIDSVSIASAIFSHDNHEQALKALYKKASFI